MKFLSGFFGKKQKGFESMNEVDGASPIHQAQDSAPVEKKTVLQRVTSLWHRSKGYEVSAQDERNTRAVDNESGIEDDDVLFTPTDIGDSAPKV